jgi:hypothetical protein
MSWGHLPSLGQHSYAEASGKIVPLLFDFSIRYQEAMTLVQNIRYSSALGRDLSSSPEKEPLAEYPSILGTTSPRVKLFDKPVKRCYDSRHNEKTCRA